MNKTAIAPVVAVLLLAIGTITGHPFSADTQSAVVDYAVAVVGAAVSIWGVYKNHRKTPGNK